MDTHITELYSGDDVIILQKKQRLWRIAAIAVAAVTLILCIVFCASSGPRNMMKMLAAAVITSTVGGWIVITIVRFALDELRYAEKHTRAVLEGERESVDGRFELTDDRTLVKRGVAMLRVDAGTESGTHALQIYEKKARRFDAKNAKRVYTVHGFIAAYEAEDENN
ncbi:MAG: hypothetical protein IK064_01230 [Clostridia bacterium]|nr:hypothetical protein [Clostridia bacterium]